MNPRSAQARYDFTGRVAVVTGAAGGIGRAICDAFSDNGASAVNWDRIAGKEGTANASAYSAAKAGVIAMTKSLGKELAQTGILVNGIAPAAAETPLLRQMAASHVQTMIDKSPVGRLGTTQEVAALELWLCSDSCTFNTGATFDLSGGRATY